jgi:DNA-binding transcriptional LysR family regulator
MELRHLEHVLAVTDAGSLSQAALRVGLTQQALSKSLARLEESLGGKLFDRETRGMALTRLGETVVEHARDVVASAGRLRTAAAAEQSLDRGKLVIGLGPIAATTRVGRKVADYAGRHPDLRIDVEAGIDRQFVEQLNHGEIDLAIAAQTENIGDSVLVEQVAREPWGVAGRVNHELLGGARRLADLENAHWLVGRNTALLDEAVGESFARSGASAPLPGVMTTSVLFAQAVLSGTDYLAILPRSICELVPNIEWRQFDDCEWSTPVYLLRRRRAHLGAGARRLVAELRSDATVEGRVDAL